MTQENHADWLPPGSDDAVNEGCLCPVLDNHHGEGMPYEGCQSWYMASDCPLHGTQAKDTLTQEGAD